MLTLSAFCVKIPVNQMGIASPNTCRLDVYPCVSGSMQPKPQLIGGVWRRGAYSNVMHGGKRFYPTDERPKRRHATDVLTSVKEARQL